MSCSSLSIFSTSRSLSRLLYRFQFNNLIMKMFSFISCWYLLTFNLISEMFLQTKERNLIRNFELIFWLEKSLKIFKNSFYIIHKDLTYGMLHELSNNMMMNIVWDDKKANFTSHPSGTSSFFIFQTHIFTLNFNHLSFYLFFYFFIMVDQLARARCKLWAIVDACDRWRKWAT